MNGEGMRVLVIFDVPNASNLDDAMARLDLGDAPAGTRIFSYSGIRYNLVGSTAAAGQMAANTVKVADTEG